MTREAIIEAAAKAALEYLVALNDPYVGANDFPGDVRVDGWVDFTALSSAILSAIEAAGMAVVPVEATEPMLAAGNDADAEGGATGNPIAIYRAMIAAAHHESP